jgi:dienelactone hydrolase
MSTSTAVMEPTRRGAASGDGAGRRDTAFLVFAGATALGLLHAVDDAVLHRQPGVPPTQHLWALLAVVVVAGPAVLLFRRLRTGLRAALALVIGAVILANGAMHVIHIAVDQISGSDATGVLAAAGGAVLVVMSAVLPFLHRGERSRTPLRRWTVRAVAASATAGVLVLVVLPIGVGIGQTHLFRSPIGAPPDSSYRDVTFRSSDGLRLAGWYTPSSNGAAVVVVSSAGGDRLGSVDHARMLAEHGYGVLLYDERGSGESEGSPNGFGWDWDQDVSAAVSFLEAQPDVDRHRIGGLGLSTGADVLIEVAASDRRLAAVVTDGATGRSLADVPAGDPWTTLQLAPTLATVALIGGTRPGPPLKDLVRQVSPTPLLLVASGSLPQEIPMNEAYADAAESPVDLWVLPEAHHTAAIHDEAAAYERRVIGFFNDALLRRTR